MPDFYKAYMPGPNDPRFPPEIETNMHVTEVPISLEDSAFANSERGLFHRYVTDLDLTPDDFKKAILDVGADGAKFANFAKENGISDNIFSVDIGHNLAGKQKAVRADANALPFKDSSFDLVISHYSVPGHEDTAIIREMIRVAKKEVRFGLKNMGTNNQVIKREYDSLKATLENLAREENLTVEEVPKELRRRKDSTAKGFFSYFRIIKPSHQ
ncbi:MAG: class I SAM-dependent methyltransferase [Candidatus Magasanikbacteria bacterium]|nr:class I SAM-dependent methyltransferase [Candidatus Magasanikbacteria bacterium]